MERTFCERVELGGHRAMVDEELEILSNRTQRLELETNSSLYLSSRFAGLVRVASIRRDSMFWRRAGNTLKWAEL